MKAIDGQCVRCGAECDGSLRRMSNRTKEIVCAPEVPRFSGGGIALCYLCQLAVSWKKSFARLCAEDVKEMADHVRNKRLPPNWLGIKRGFRDRYAHRSDLWERVIALSETSMSAKEIAAEVGLSDPSRVYDIWKKHDIPSPTNRRKDSRRSAALDRFGRRRAQKVVDMKRAGQSWSTIAAILGEKKEAVLAAAIWMGEVG